MIDSKQARDLTKVPSTENSINVSLDILQDTIMAMAKLKYTECLNLNRGVAGHEFLCYLDNISQ